MTVDQFLDKLGRTPRDWMIQPNGAIRRWRSSPPTHKQFMCPLDAVPETRGHGFSAMNKRAVMDAADSHLYTAVPDLRVQLLQRTGLAELEAR